MCAVFASLESALFIVALVVVGIVVVGLLAAVYLAVAGSFGIGRGELRLTSRTKIRNRVAASILGLFCIILGVGLFALIIYTCYTIGDTVHWR
jgi:hypothetical protein